MVVSGRRHPGASGMLVMFCFLNEVRVTWMSSICENPLSYAFMIYARTWMCYTSIKKFRTRREAKNR